MIKFLTIAFVAVLSLSLTKNKNLDGPKIAICIIGSDTEPDYASMNNTVSVLQRNGYTVVKFFDPNNQWEAIKRAASEASIIVYDGHGTEMGIDGNYGGLVIDDFISGKRIASELKLKRKALVIYSSVCGGAGSSASDMNDIGIEEAKRRILGSGLPFILAGAGAYFAINEVNGVESFLNNWFEEESLSECFVKATSSWYNVEFNGSFRDQRLPANFQMGIGTQEGGGVSTVTSTVNGVTKVRQIVSPKSYDIAYLGNPFFTHQMSMSLNQ